MTRARRWTKVASGIVPLPRVGRAPRVLVVEDHRYLGGLLPDVLPQGGFEVSLVTDTSALEEALETFEPMSLLPDFRLRGGHGSSPLPQGATLRGDVPVILHTAIDLRTLDFRRRSPCRGSPCCSSPPTSRPRSPGPADLGAGRRPGGRHPLQLHPATAAREVAHPQLRARIAPRPPGRDPGPQLRVARPPSRRRGISWRGWRPPGLRPAPRSADGAGRPWSGSRRA